MGLNDIIKLVISILACFAAAGIGSLFTFKAIAKLVRRTEKTTLHPTQLGIWACLDHPIYSDGNLRFSCLAKRISH